MHPQDAPTKNANYYDRLKYLSPNNQPTPATDDEKLLLQQAVGLFLYYARAVDSTMLFPLNALAAQISTCNSNTMKELQHFFNYAATHPDAKIVYKRSDMILHIYTDASYLTAAQAKSRAGGYFYLSNQHYDPHGELNGSIYIECSVMKNVLASAMEAELGGMFRNAQQGAWIRTILEEMGHKQPPTFLITDNTAAKSVAEGTAKQRKSRAINMNFYWIRDRINQGQFQIIWEKGTNNIADYFTKFHPTYHHRKIRYRILEPTTKDKIIRLTNNTSKVYPARVC